MKNDPINYQVIFCLDSSDPIFLIVRQLIKISSGKLYHLIIHQNTKLLFLKEIILYSRSFI